MRPILITGYVNPDLDGVACMVAYAEFLSLQNKEAIGGIMGDVQEEPAFMAKRFSLSLPIKIEHPEEFEKVILVDASDLIGLEGNIDPERVIEIIDHRQVHEADKFPNAIVQVELVGSAATLVGERFMRAGLQISEASARWISGAIISGTLNFQSSVTTDRDRILFEWLKPYANLPEDFWQEMFAAKSDLSGAKLQERMEGDFATFEMGAKKVGIAQLEIMGVKALLNTRLPEVTRELDRLKKEMHLDIVFQSTIALEEGKNYFVTSDLAAQSLLEKALGVHFIGSVAELFPALMRKQIVPQLKKTIN